MMWKRFEGESFEEAVRMADVWREANRGKINVEYSNRLETAELCRITVLYNTIVTKGETSWVKK